IDARREIVEHHRHHHPRSLDARLAMTDVRINRDALLPLHCLDLFGEKSGQRRLLAGLIWGRYQYYTSNKGGTECSRTDLATVKRSSAKGVPYFTPPPSCLVLNRSPCPLWACMF